MKFLKKIFQKKPKTILAENGMRIVPAFELKGETYYMHEDPLTVCAGRGLSAMVALEEVLMRCNVEYLNYHCEAVDKIFEDPKKTDLPTLYRLHYNLKERIKFLVALPEQVFKLASIVYFTKEESPFRYDSAFNKKKINDWMKEKDTMYDFFLQTPLKTLIPYLDMPGRDTKEYLEVQEKISQIHFQDLQKVLSREIL